MNLVKILIIMLNDTQCELIKHDVVAEEEQETSQNANVTILSVYVLYTFIQCHLLSMHFK